MEQESKDQNPNGLTLAEQFAHQHNEIKKSIYEFHKEVNDALKTIDDKAVSEFVEGALGAFPGLKIGLGEIVEYCPSDSVRFKICLETNSRHWYIPVELDVRKLQNILLHLTQNSQFNNIIRQAIKNAL